MRSGKDWGRLDLSFNHDSEILMYQIEDGQTKIDVRMEDETVWLTQSQMACFKQPNKMSACILIIVLRKGSLIKIQLSRNT